ncbi:hypothetical protein Zmor_025037 [Zophobas morio]|uniref:Uncharacterized protein n=1 Tax=Zophobas morio TaxID=2755281 RepID=A0AA38M479_9CUCU|nr:hypothetical protein Zmor_025037 [Zophobas morio]
MMTTAEDVFRRWWRPWRRRLPTLKRPAKIRHPANIALGKNQNKHNPASVPASVPLRRRIFPQSLAGASALDAPATFCSHMTDLINIQNDLLNMRAKAAAAHLVVCRFLIHAT